MGEEEDMSKPFQQINCWPILKQKNMSLKYFFSFWVLPQPLFDLPIFIFFATSDRVIQTLIPFWESAMAAHLKGFDLFRDCILHQSILTSLVVEILVLSP